MKFYCIGDEDTVRGFRLAGVQGKAAATPRETAAALAEAVEDPDCGIVIITEGAAEGSRIQVDEIRLRRSRPLIVEIPGPAGPFPGYKRIERVVRAAVGVTPGVEERIRS